MPASVPTLDELRSQAALRGVSPTDEDLERVQAFLTVLLPAFDELERIVGRELPTGTVIPPEEL